jgi:hypothetical protein
MVQYELAYDKLECLDFVLVALDQLIQMLYYQILFVKAVIIFALSNTETLRRMIAEPLIPVELNIQFPTS